VGCDGREAGFRRTALEHSFNKPTSSKPLHKIHIAPGGVLWECNLTPIG
jgi:hypothetical protein